jgi:hypothetical protein
MPTQGVRIQRLSARPGDDVPRIINPSNVGNLGFYVYGPYKDGKPMSMGINKFAVASAKEMSRPGNFLIALDKSVADAPSQ